MDLATLLQFFNLRKLVSRFEFLREGRDGQSGNKIINFGPLLRTWGAETNKEYAIFNPMMEAGN